MTDVSLNEVVLREAESSRAALAAFVRGLAPDEFTWSPDDGIPSARDIVSALLADESRRRESLGGPRRPVGKNSPSPSSPVAASDLLRAERTLTTSMLHQNSNESAVTILALLLADTRAMSGVVALQRLIDPARVLPV